MSTEKVRIVETRQWELIPMPISEDQLKVLLEQGYVPTAPLVMVRDKTPKEKLNPQMPPGPKVLENVVPFVRTQRLTEAQTQALQAKEEALEAEATRLH